ncbi:unnamed protein product [Brachionus calyciflorus]|uniref:Uncharacterized protein n=1 Tax=Brachionus calyciflorus TaxID=104777 RepID=A0A814E755_9BILA|nr:unnamed protein product [Brachionus calyciflorus]
MKDYLFIQLYSNSIIGTSVIFLKYDGTRVFDLYNAYIQNYIPPIREALPIILQSEQNIDGIVTIQFQRDVSYTSSIDPNIFYDLTNCYKMAIVTGPIINGNTLQHTRIPLFTQTCVIAAEIPETQINLNTANASITNRTLTNRMAYILNITINDTFTDALLNNKSTSYFRLKFRIQRYIEDALIEKNLKIEVYDLVNLLPGSIVSISRVVLEGNDNLEGLIQQALVEYDEKNLKIDKDRIFVSLENMANTTTTSPSNNETIFFNSTLPNFFNTTTINATTLPIFNTTAIVSNLSNVTTMPMSNMTVIITTKELPIEFFALELTINSNFSNSLKNESSNDYIEFKNKLQNYVSIKFLGYYIY